MSPEVTWGLQASAGQERALGVSSAAQPEMVVPEGKGALPVPATYSFALSELQCSEKGVPVCQVVTLCAGTWAEADLREARLTVLSPPSLAPACFSGHNSEVSGERV